MTINSRSKFRFDDSKVDGDLNKFPLSKDTIEQLKQRKVEQLFPVQAKTFAPIYEGRDVIALARTGTGKTLAFVLPIIETLKKHDHGKSVNPRVIVLAPTRELATQISADFESVSRGFIVLSVYGGTPYEPQCKALKYGVDIVVGTPGRVLDLQSKGVLKVDDIKFVVLDEVDRMLDMGFSKDVDSILESLYANKADSKPQTLLFSATLPNWVSEVADKYLSDNPFTISLVDPNESKASMDVTHYSLMCPREEKIATIADVIRMYASGRDSRAIIFCEKKKQADEIAASSFMSSDCHVLHGDIPQEKRELVMNGFKSGKYRVLITTNVAARGIDVPNVDLVIQVNPPKDIEDYIHRSGRTGRAGRKGIAVSFHSQNETRVLQEIEAAAGIKFVRMSAPSTGDIIDSFGSELVKPLLEIPEDTWRAFKPAGDQVIKSIMEDSEFSQEEALERALCCALAMISGKTGTLDSRSLISARRGFVTYQLKTQQKAERKGYAYSLLRKYLPEDLLDAIKNLSFIKDRSGFVLDFPEEKEELVKKNWADNDLAQLSKLDTLPEIETEEYGKNFGGGGRGGGRNFGGGQQNRLSFNNSNGNNERRSFGNNNFQHRQPNFNNNNFRGGGRGAKRPFGDRGGEDGPNKKSIKLS